MSNYSTSDSIIINKMLQIIRNDFPYIHEGNITYSLESVISYPSLYYVFTWNHSHYKLTFVYDTVYSYNEDDEVYVLVKMCVGYLNDVKNLFDNTTYTFSSIQEFKQCVDLFSMRAYLSTSIDLFTDSVTAFSIV